MDELRVDGYIPGGIGRIVELHGTYYSRHWNFGLYFERKVATEMAAFLGRRDDRRNGFWLAIVNDAIIGGIAIDGIHAAEQGAHLRWFIVDPAFRGRRVGTRLLHTALDFCRHCAYRRVYLWTFAGLDAARHLYEASGFVLCKEHVDRQWGTPVREQMFELLYD